MTSSLVSAHEQPAEAGGRVVDMTAKIEHFVRRVVDELWNEKRPELIEQLFTAECTLYTPDVVLEGHAGARQLYDTFTTAFPDFRVRTSSLTAMS